MQLSDSTHAEITALCKQGDDLVRAGDLDAGKKNYIAALRLLPADHREWEAATWIYVAIGDVHFKTKSYDKAFKCFFNAVQCPKGLGNPYIHLRLGQMYYEQENLEKAADELTRAYMGAGIAIFMEDDPKYLEFLETKIEI
ncbi:tetratricopeptide repeat protein [Paenibacillus tuaregi]|uniref:tetratricopeptide repeat protein n=1 Tax=Paenibacillus tuaregi TaxID=1816681 RepID=UPI000838B491|nr:tetratricopeptide repeat protein [Paenibacillus tuaregi]